MNSDDSTKNTDDNPRVQSTHAQPGAGRPRLVFEVDPGQWDGGAAREFDLLMTTTRIGSGADTDLRLDGLDTLHAEIRHDERDEYVLYAFGEAELSSELTSPDEDAIDDVGRILRTGSKVQLGEWAMSFFREEFSDHGRPFGGREGGEGATQLDQSGEPLNQQDA
ncbi:MAG: hypothetical protein ABIW81_08110 [Terrimesophilobacter sp.]